MAEQFNAPSSPAASDAQELDFLRQVCSRINGDAYCRCGGNLNGRYCLWSYYRLNPGFEKIPATAKSGDHK